MASNTVLLPSGGSGIEPTQRNLKTGTRFGAVSACDRERHMVMDFLPALAAAASLVSIGAGASVLAEVAASNIGAIFMDTDNDSHGFMTLLPWNIDVAQDIRFAVYFNQSQGAGTGSVLWTLKYTELIAGTTTIAAGGTALDTIIPSCADLAVDVLTLTEYGVLDGGTLSGKRGIDCLVFDLIYTETTITDAELLGVVWDYGVLLK